MYRSGTTYLSRILGAHSKLDITYDSVNYFRFIIKKNISSTKYKKIVNSILDRLSTRYKIKLDKDKVIYQIESSGNPINHKIIYCAVMGEFFNNSGKRWGEKTLLEWSNIPKYLSMFSNGKCIHVIRDPRDVLASFKNMTFEKGDNYLDAIFASLNSLNTAIKYKTMLPKTNYLIMNYDDLIKNTKKTTQAICEFLEIDYEESMLNSKNYKTLDGSPFEFKTHSSFPKEDVKPINRWRTKLTDFEIDLTEAIIGQQMLSFGYKLNTDFKKNSLTHLIELIFNNQLINERFIHLIKTRDGVESYPSDPTKPENWGGDTGVTGLGAAKAYGRE